MSYLVALLGVFLFLGLIKDGLFLYGAVAVFGVLIIGAVLYFWLALTGRADPFRFIARK